MQALEEDDDEDTVLSSNEVELPIVELEDLDLKKLEEAPNNPEPPKRCGMKRDFANIVYTGLCFNLIVTSFIASQVIQSQTTFRDSISLSISSCIGIHALFFFQITLT